MSENKKRNHWGYFGLILAPAVLLLAFFIFGNTTVSAQVNPSTPNNPTTPSTPTNPNDPSTPDTDTPDEQATTDDDDITCAIEKIGWILCPIIEQSGRIGDQAFAFLAKNFLETEPELISNSSSGTKTAWEMARNLANIMFIIAFLIIIYSQVTGAGITNYGIKKMLPRLILAAIAVNVSYYICQAMVDITNIMGYEIQQFLTDAAKAVTVNTAMPVSSGDSFESGGGVLSTIAVFVLAAGAIVYFLIPVLGAVIGLVLITCLSIIVILLLRKAFIVLLIVASPIAFVLYLLPNTEKYFQKWLSMFWKLLLVFPVIGMLMGAGQLASSVILVAGVSSNSNSYKDSGDKCINLPKHSGDSTSAASGGECTTGAVPFLLGLTAAGIAVLPLIAVYSVLQGALSAAGAIGGKIGGSINSWNNGRKGNLSKQRQELGEARRNQRALAAMENKGSFSNIATAGGVRRRAFRDARRSSVKQQLGRATEDAVFEKALDGNGDLTRYGEKMAGAGLLRNAGEDAQKRVTRSLQGIEQKNENEATAALQYQFKDANPTELMNELDNAIKANDRIMIRAFTESLSKMGAGGYDKIAAMAEKHTDSATFRSVINNHTDMKSKRADVDAWATAGPDETTGAYNALSSFQNENVYRKLTNGQLQSQTAESLAHGESVLDDLVSVKTTTSTGEIKVKQVKRAVVISELGDIGGDSRKVIERHT